MKVVASAVANMETNQTATPPPSSRGFNDAAATLRAARALASSLGIVHLGEFEQDVGLIRREIRARGSIRLAEPRSLSPG